MGGDVGICNYFSPSTGGKATTRLGSCEVELWLRSEGG